MRSDDAQLSVEVPGAGFRVVRMAGVLDRSTAPRLARLVQAQLRHVPCAGHLVVDLGEVRFFGCGEEDLAALVAVRDAGRDAGVRVHLAGLAGHGALLPTSVTSALAQFSVFATVEQAQRELVGRRARRPVATGPRSGYEWPCPVPPATGGDSAARSDPSRSA